MKKVLAVLLAAVMTLSLAACGGQEPAAASDNSQANTSASAVDPAQKIKIGILEAQSIDETVNRRNYYETYIAPNYNVEFVFSEAAKSTETAISFVEDCADSGCVGIISYFVNDTAQLTKIALDNGIKYVVNGNRTSINEDAFTGGFSNFVGSFGSNVKLVGKIFVDWLKANASADGSEGFLVTSLNASQGNPQHLEITIAILTALQEIYGITYEDTIENIAVNPSPMEVKNDKNINIYLYPGAFTAEGWLQGLSTVLQTGKYLTFLQQANFAASAVVVEETEQSIGKNIKVAAMGNMSQTLIDAFNAKDQFGNSSVDMSTIKSTSVLSAIGFIKLYNSLTGFEACNVDANGEPTGLTFLMWAVNSIEEVDVVKEWDIAGNNKWVCDTTIIDQMLGIKNPDLTHESIQAVIDSITIEDAVKRLS